MVEEKPNNVSLDDRYRKSEAVISRVIAGEAVLVPLRHSSADLESIYALNETAALAWEALDGAAPLRAVLRRILAEFEVGEAEAAQDLLELIAELRRLGAVEKV